MAGGRFHLGLVKLLKQPPRRLMARKSLVELSFCQRERAEPAQIYALAPEVAQFLANLQSRFIRLPGIAVLAAGAKRIPELRPQRRRLRLTMIVQTAAMALEARP